MRIPTITGIIERRILVNYRVAPDRLAANLPKPFRPKLFDGCGIGGICLIRLGRIRPRGVPALLGLRSENAAHRVAVEWEVDGKRHEGVHIPRRDTESRFNALIGGRVFPGEHHHARFSVQETEHAFSISMNSSDGHTAVDVKAHIAEALPRTSIFPDLETSSAFFEAGALGYSATAKSGRFDGLELCCRRWAVTPLSVETVHSSWFDDPARFPPGTATFDCALLMREIEHEWRSREDLCCATGEPLERDTPIRAASSVR